jgi:hypothetical protein
LIVGVRGKNSGTHKGLEWFGPLDHNTLLHCELYCLRSCMSLARLRLCVYLKLGLRAPFVTSYASPFIAEGGHAQKDWALTCGPSDIKNIVLGCSNVCCQDNPLVPWRSRSAYPWRAGEASCRREDEYSAPLGTGALFASRPSRRAACWMTLTPPASGWDETH